MKRLVVFIFLIIVVTGICNTQSDDEFRRFMVFGKEAYEENLINDALEYFTKAKNLKRNYPPIYYILGEVYEKNEDVKNAVAHYKIFLKLAPTQEKAKEVQDKVYVLEYKLEKENKKRQAEEKAEKERLAKEELIKKNLEIQKKKNHEEYQEFVANLKKNFKGIKLRSNYKKLGHREVGRMLKKYGFYAKYHDYNKAHNSSGNFKNNYFTTLLRGDAITIDSKTGLMWRMYTPNKDEKCQMSEISNEIKKINQKGYATFHNWRLPTLEEVSSLLNSKKNKQDKHLDKDFLLYKKKNESWKDIESIWTGDLVKHSYAGSRKTKDLWIVTITFGNLLSNFGHRTSDKFDLLLVRSIN